VAPQKEIMSSNLGNRQRKSTRKKIPTIWRFRLNMVQAPDQTWSAQLAAKAFPDLS
jgi:hypothetical protein